MNAIALVERRIAGDLCEQERKKRHLVLFREIGKRLTKRYDVLGTEVRRRFHAGQQHRDVPGLRALDDRGEVLLHLRDRQSAQAVVRAKFEDENTYVGLIERPVETLQAGRRGVARDTRVDDVQWIVGVVELLLQQRGIRLRLLHAQARRQAVTEDDDLWACRVARRLRGRTRSGRRGRARARRSGLAFACAGARGQDD